MIERLLLAFDEAIEALKKHPSREISLFHHNDTDGLSAGSILKGAFSDAGYTVTACALEKPYPQVLEKILSGSGGIAVFADFAGKIAPIISEINGGRNLVLILDHHPAEETEDETVFVLDGELFGLKGDRDISASAACYLFAERLLSAEGLPYRHYSHLGVLGAIGDGFLVDGALAGANRLVLDTASSEGLVEIEKTTEGETYSIILGGKRYPADRICTLLDTAGGVGYYSDGVDLGMEICRNGLSETTASRISDLERTKDSIFKAETERLKTGLRTSRRIQWFDVEDRFRPMGIKMIGVFCTLIKDEDFLDGSRYLAGFQHIPENLPGFGDIGAGYTKISMRVSEGITEEIREGRRPGLNSFLPEATSRLGGFSDACHRLSAATTVGIGQEEALITEMERVLDEMEGNK